MKGYFKASFVATSLLVLASAIFMGGCTKVDDTLGLDLVPDDQKVVLQTKSFEGVKSYVAKSELIPTGNLRRMVFGSMQTDFGRTSASGVYQFMPLESYTKRGDHYFGAANVEPDSAYIVLYINKISGDARTPQTFQIFPLKETMKYDSTYYPTAKVDDNVKADPVFEFTFEKEIQGARYKKIWSKDDTSAPLYQAGKDYLSGIIGLDREVWKDEEKGKGLFHKEVPGFYITPKTLDGKSIYEIIMADSYYLQDLSYLAIYTHTGEGKDAKVLETKFYFDDKETSYKELSNVSIALITHDYSTSTNGVDESTFLKYVKKENDDTDDEEESDTEKWVMPDLEKGGAGETPIPTQDIMYVQSMTGLSGYIYFDENFKQNLRDGILKYDEHEYSSVFINRAKLVVPMAQGVDNPAYADYAARSLNRIGLYFDYQGDLPTSMPDYPYMDEILNETESSFGGYLNYSKGYYEMDISTYIRQLINNPDKTRSQLWISQGFSSNGFSRLEEVALSNSADRPIRLEITYTLIK